MKDGDRTEPGEREHYVHFLSGNEAYVREIVVEGAAVYGIHTPDGRLLGVAPSRDTAFAAARQHELTPLSVH